MEVLAAAAPSWLAGAFEVAGWNKHYGVRVDSWRLPASKAKQAELALAYGRNGFALLAAVYAPDAPEDGQEVVKRREAEVDGLPPGTRLSSPVRHRRPVGRQTRHLLARLQSPCQRNLRHRRRQVCGEVADQA